MGLDKIAKKECEKQGHPNSEPISIGKIAAVLYCPTCDYLFNIEITPENSEKFNLRDFYKRKRMDPDSFCEFIEKISIGDPHNVYFYIPRKFRGQKVILPKKFEYKGKGPGIPIKVFAQIPIEDLFDVTLNVPEFAYYVGVRDHMLDQHNGLKQTQILEYYDSRKTYGSREELFNQILYHHLLGKLERIFRRIGRLKVNIPKGPF